MAKDKEEIDLESAVCDVASMADVCMLVMGALEKEERSIAEILSAKQAAEHMAYWRETYAFCVMHREDMTKALKATYYASVE